jgi:hypothetical protein
VSLPYAGDDGLIRLQINGRVITLEGRVEVDSDHRAARYLDLRGGCGDEGSRRGDEPDAHRGRQLTGGMYEELPPAGSPDDAGDEHAGGGLH